MDEETERKLRDLADEVVVESLPNVGRCDHTYLYHMVHAYDDLGETTIFLPGSATLPLKWPKTITTTVNAIRTADSCIIPDVLCDVSLEEAFSEFWMAGHSCSSKENAAADTEMGPCPDRPFRYWIGKYFSEEERSMMREERLIPFILNHERNGRNIISYQGIMAFSRVHLHRRTRAHYQTFLEQLDHHSNPEVGHYIERAWVVIVGGLPRRCIPVISEYLIGSAIPLLHLFHKERDLFPIPESIDRASSESETGVKSALAPAAASELGAAIVSTPGMALHTTTAAPADAPTVTNVEAEEAEEEAEEATGATDLQHVHRVGIEVDRTHAEGSD